VLANQSRLGCKRMEQYIFEIKYGGVSVVYKIYNIEKVRKETNEMGDNKNGHLTQSYIIPE